MWEVREQRGFLDRKHSTRGTMLCYQKRKRTQPQRKVRAPPPPRGSSHYPWQHVVELLQDVQPSDFNSNCCGKCTLDEALFWFYKFAASLVCGETDSVTGLPRFYCSDYQHIININIRNVWRSLIVLIFPFLSGMSAFLWVYVLCNDSVSLTRQPGPLLQTSSQQNVACSSAT